MRGGKRKGAGRKPSPDSRRNKVMVRLNEDEKAWLTARAANKNITASDVFRRLIADEMRRESDIRDYLRY